MKKWHCWIELHVDRRMFNSEMRGETDMDTCCEIE